MQGRKESRRSLFEHVERQHLRPLPAQPFAWKQQRELTVQKNCHVQISDTKHYYSVPFRHIGRKVKVLYDTQHVEVFYQNERIALHAYSHKQHGYSTQKDHMPSAHRFVSEWSAEYFIRRAQVVGPHTAEILTQLLNDKADGTYLKKLNHITRHNLLILDDFGLHPFQEADQLILYDLIEDITHKHALILTSQIPVEHWHQLISQSTLADAVMDRIIHKAHRIELKGDSMRKSSLPNN